MNFQPSKFSPAFINVHTIYFTHTLSVQAKTDLTLAEHNTEFTYTHSWVVHMRSQEQCMAHLMATGSLCWNILQTLKDSWLQRVVVW